MSNTAHDATEQQASAQADASLRRLMSSWQAVFASSKLKLHCHADLIGADFRLSVKALALSLLSILIFAGLVMILWSTLMVSLAFALLSFGLHWLGCAAVVLVINLGALYLVKQVLSDALQSISMRASVDALLTSDNHQ